MASVAQSTYTDLASIAEAFRQGQISREQAESLSAERYQLGMMQFQLLSTFHQSLEQDIERAEAKQAQPRASDDLLVASPPVASSEVPQAVINYLELTPPQVAAIQAQIAEERSRLQSLMEQLVKIRRELVAATAKGRFDSNQVTHLADEQSRILKQFIVASARLQAKVYSILTTEQQRKFDALGEQIAASVKPSFAGW